MWVNRFITDTQKLHDLVGRVEPQRGEGFAVLKQHDGATSASRPPHRSFLAILPEEVVQFLRRCFATRSVTLPLGESDAVAAGEGFLWLEPTFVASKPDRPSPRLGSTLPEGERIYVRKPLHHGYLKTAPQAG